MRNITVKIISSRKYTAQAILFKNKNIKLLTTDSLILNVFLLHSFTTKCFDFNLFKVYKCKKHI